MTLLELNYQRRKARAEATSLLDAAMMEARSLTLPEQVRFDSFTARIQDLDTATTERQALRKLAL